MADSTTTTHTIGRRKEARCRLYLKPGSGKWQVDSLGRFDIIAKVEGGGLTGQAGALRLAVARALVKIDESHRRKLRDLGLLTRDARAVERKKPGRPKARKKFQFSKR